MWHKDNDRVERFFQDSVRQYPERFNESDWKNMEAMLDEQARVVAMRRRRIWYYMGSMAWVLTITALVGLYFYRSEHTDIKTTVNHTSNSRTGEEGLPGTLHEPAGEATQIQKTPEKKYTREGNHKTIVLGAGAQGETVDQSINNHPPVVVRQPHATGASAVALDTDVKHKDRLVSEISQRKPTTSFRSRQPVSVRDIKTLQSKDDLFMLEDSATADAVETDSLHDEPHKSLPRWSVGLVTFPDFTRTPKSDFKCSGDTYGILISYRFFRRWTLHTGALKSVKKYWGYGNEYVPPPGYWEARTQGIIPEKVQGNCAVLEIPVMLSYNFLQTKRSSAFVTIGVSSYIMERERYWYTFNDPDPSMAKGWATDQSSSYTWGVGGIYAGYEYTIRRHLAVGLTPFYKIPFDGMGWANVNLYSTGVYCSVLYKF